MNDKVWIIIFACVIDTKCVNVWITKRTQDIVKAANNENSFSNNQAYHTERKTWRAASDECGSSGLEFDENKLKNTDVLLNKKFWIGTAIYRLTTPWIEILGCDAEPVVQDVNKSPSLVLCQKKCEPYQFFGYSEATKMCSCQHSKESTYSVKNCIAQYHLNYLFVYKVFSGQISGNSDGKCTTLNCLGERNRLNIASCDETNNKWASRCYNGSVVGWGLPYSTSKEMCLGLHQLLLPPETYCHLQGHENEATPSWTNVFRAETEAKLTQVEVMNNNRSRLFAESSSKEPIYCLEGSVTENNGKREFNSTRRVCNDQLDFFLCRTDTASSTTFKQSPVDGKFSSTQHSSAIQNLKPGEVSTTIPSHTKIGTKKTKKESGTTLDIGAVIGGITAAVIILAILLVLTVCKIRSCGFFKMTITDKQEVQFSREFYEHSQNSEVRTSVKPTSNESYGLASINTVHMYAVVNKIKKNGLQTTEDTYTETSYGEYDRLNGASKMRTYSKTNLYDSHVGIRNESDPTYDSSDQGGRKLQLNNDVYDHTDTVSTDGSDYGYSSTLKSEVRNENEVYDKTV